MCVEAHADITIGAGIGKTLCYPPNYIVVGVVRYSYIPHGLLVIVITTIHKRVGPGHEADLAS